MTSNARWLTILLVCLTLFGCNDKPTSDKSLLGLEERSLIDKLDKPNQIQIINLTENSNLSEYRSNLYKLYPDLKTGDTVRIKEVLWKREDNTEAAWFRLKGNKWVVFDHLKWSNDINF